MSENELEQALHHRVHRLNAKLQGIVLGVFFGVGLFIATAWLVIKGGDPVGPHLSLLGAYFPGYTVSWPGAFFGFFYAFIIGFSVGYCTAVLYNALVGLRRKQSNSSDQ